jgi:hypothetical protein
MDQMLINEAVSEVDFLSHMPIFLNYSWPPVTFYALGYLLKKRHTEAAKAKYYCKKQTVFVLVKQDEC